MKNKIENHIITLFTVVTLNYLAASFIESELNPLMFPKEVRSPLVCCIILSYYLMLTVLNKKK